jgi:hypothetical protein
MADVAAMDIMRVIDSHRGIGIQGHELERIMLEEYSSRIVRAAFGVLMDDGKITQGADLRWYRVD